MDSPGGSLEKVRLQDQGDLNICTFNSLSQMVDAYRHSSGDTDTKHVTSPLAMGIQRHSIPVESNLSYVPKTFFFELSGTVCSTFNLLKDNGYGACNEASFLQALKGRVEDKSFFVQFSKEASL